MKLNWSSHEIVLLGILQLFVELTCLCLGLLALRTFLAQFCLDLLHFLLQGFEAGTYTVKRGLELFYGKFCSTFIQLVRIDLINLLFYETAFLVCNHIFTIVFFVNLRSCTL